MYGEESERTSLESAREVWVRWAFLTSILAALLAALAVAFAAAWARQAGATAVQRQRHWVTYQALTTRTEALRHSRILVQLYLLQEPRNPKLAKFLEDKSKELDKEVAALEEEWQQFKAASESLDHQGIRFSQRTIGAVRSGVLWLLAAFLAAISGLSRKKLPWLAALLLTLLGLVSLLGAALT